MSSGGRHCSTQKTIGGRHLQQQEGSVSASDSACSRRSPTCGDTCHPRIPLTRCRSSRRSATNARSEPRVAPGDSPACALSPLGACACRRTSHGGGAAADSGQQPAEPWRPFGRTPESGERASGLAAVCSGWSECRFERFGCIRQQTASLHLPPLGVRPDVRTGVAPEIEELLGNRGKPDSHARATRAREVADDGMALLNRVPPFHERTLGQRRASRKVQCRWAITWLN